MFKFLSLKISWKMIGNEGITSHGTQKNLIGYCYDTDLEGHYDHSCGTNQIRINTIIKGRKIGIHVCAGKYFDEKVRPHVNKYPNQDYRRHESLQKARQHMYDNGLEKYPEV